MSDHTRGPCGCGIEWAYSDTHPPVIHYCPTHAAAPALLAKVDAYEHILDMPEQSPDALSAEVARLITINADLLAALIHAEGYIVDNDLPVPDVIPAAIAQAKEDADE